MFASGCFTRWLGLVELREDTVDTKAGVDVFGIAARQLSDARLDLSPYHSDLLVHASIKALGGRDGYVVRRDGHFAVTPIQTKARGGKYRYDALKHAL